MPRSNRTRGHKPEAADEPGERDLARILGGVKRTEQRRGATWNVQPVTTVQSVKSYLCPGCSLEVVPGTAHVVVWRADGVLGDAADIAARRHWHSHCWKIT